MTTMDVMNTIVDQVAKQMQSVDGRDEWTDAPPSVMRGSVEKYKFSEDKKIQSEVPTSPDKKSEGCVI